MDYFLKALLGPVFILALGIAISYLRAFSRNTPLARPGEFLKYINCLYKPAFWAFVSMFVIVFIFGAVVNGNYLEVIQKAITAGLYTTSFVFLFMIQVQFFCAMKNSYCLAHRKNSISK